MKMKYIPVLWFMNAAFFCCVAGGDVFRTVPLESTINRVQPHTGIVLWSDNENNRTDAIQLEYSYMSYDAVVQDSGVYDWSSVDNLLDDVASRRHQAILRFRFVYPGYPTSVPAYLKDRTDYHETEGESEGLTTSFPDWSNTELQRFAIEFYSRFSDRYDTDPRLAFLQTGFGLWAEYHIYDGPFVPGETFPDKSFQASFFNHLDTVFKETHWSISIDAADEDYSPFSKQASLKDIDFGLFDDSFMHEEHGGYNMDCWEFFGRERYLRSPAGGEFSYYTDYDQEHVLDTDGIHGVSWEEAAAAFHITYMIGNDQPDYQSMDRIKKAGMVCGYRFHIMRFLVSSDSSIIEVENRGFAPLYYDAFVAVNSVRSETSLKYLAPGERIVCPVPAGGDTPLLTIECDRLVPTQKIGFDAYLDADNGIWNGSVKRYTGEYPGNHTEVSVYTCNGRRLLKEKHFRMYDRNKAGVRGRDKQQITSGMYIYGIRRTYSTIENMVLVR
jgi:hypothetical protein